MTLSYQVSKIRYHLFGTDVTAYGGDEKGRLDLGKITGQGAEIEVVYTVLRNLVLNTSLSYVGGVYKGTFPESATLDDGKFHGSIQDGTFGATYSIPVSGFNLAPSASYRFPAAHYDHHGHVAAGTHTKSFELGLGIGRALAPTLPDAFGQVSYAHQFNSDIEQWGRDGDRYELDLGYYVLPQLVMRSYFNYFEVKDGISWATDDFTKPGVEHNHDAAAATLVRRAGGAVTYQFDESKSVFVDIGGVLSGRNTHDSVYYTLGTSWNFVTPFAH